MRVLHVIPSVSERSGGPAQAIFPMCRALQEQGTEVVIVSTDHGLELKPRLQTEPQIFQGVKIIFFPSQWGDSFKYSRPVTNWLNVNVAGFDVVHIHAVFNHACLAAARACRKHQVPYVVRPLGTLSPWGMHQKSLRKTIFWQIEGKRMLKSAAAVHYTAVAERVTTEESLGLNHGRVVPLGVSVDSDGPMSEQATLAEVSVLNPYLLVLSRLHPKKGLEVFLDAFLTLVETPEFAHWRLVLAGEGPDDYVRLLRAKVQSRRAMERVIFTGWLQNQRKNAFLRSASLLALPSYYENFGLCVMEAMAVGIPVLVSPHVNLADDIKNAQAGWITEVNQQALETTLAEILRSPEERCRRAAAGKKLSMEFTWAGVASQLNKLYEEVAAI